MNRHIPCKTYNQTAFAASGIRILLKYLPTQQGFFDRATFSAAVSLQRTTTF